MWAASTREETRSDTSSSGRARDRRRRRHARVEVRPRVQQLGRIRELQGLRCVTERDGLDRRRAELEPQTDANALAQLARHERSDQILRSDARLLVLDKPLAAVKRDAGVAPGIGEDRLSLRSDADPQTVSQGNIPRRLSGLVNSKYEIGHDAVRLNAAQL